MILRIMRALIIFALLGLLAQYAWIPNMISADDTGESVLQDPLVDELRELTNGKVRISTHAKTGKVRFIGTEPANPVPQPSTLLPEAAAEQAARGFMARYARLFGLSDPSKELTLARSNIIANGRSVTRFQQIYENIPIIGGELVIQTATTKHGVISANGEILPDIVLNISPSVTTSSAQETALNLVARTYKIDPAELIVSEPELWIYNPLIFGMNDDHTSLVWRMEVESTSLLHVREFVLIDAHLGSVTLHFNQIETDKNREVYDAACGNTLPGTLVRSEGESATGDTDQDNAYDYAGDTYDFYSSEHGRDSIDDAGMTIISTTDYDDDGVGNCNYANAFWNGSQVVYGRGYASADDVVAHELTHGVTDYESNLYYYMQSGAINEAFSDIWGEFVDLTNGAGTDTSDVRWQIGEDLPSGYIRNMQDPTDKSDPDKMTSSYYYCGSSDNGGVHTNNGVGNKATYLMVDGDTFNGITVTGMGISKTADVWYEVQTNLMTSAGDYADLYDYLQQAAINLGYSSADQQTVQDAIDATEMNQSPACPAVQAPICSTGPAYNLWVDDLESTGSGNWTSAALIGSNEWYYPQNSNPYSYNATYATSGVYNLWGYDQIGVADYYIAMTTDVTLPANAYMHFSHAYRFDYVGTSYYDGGVVEYSTDSGSNWNDAGPFFTHNGYNGTIVRLANPNQRNPLALRSAFVAYSNGYISSRLNLSSLSGESIRFRFRIGTDYIIDDHGWFIDDVRIYTCGTPTLTSTDSGGNEVNTFAPGQTVYVKGSGLHPNRTYKLWLQDESVSDEEWLLTSEDPSGAQVTVTTGPDNGNTSGGFPPTAIWAIPADAQVTHNEYDIVADKQSDAGKTDRYNVASDFIDSATVAGIIAPIPELPTIILLGTGLVALTGYLILRKSHRLRKGNTLPL